MMSPNRVLLILLFVAIIAVFAYLILNPIITSVSRQIDKTPGAADLAVNWIGGQMTQAAASPTLGTPPVSVAEVVATVAGQQVNAESTRQAEQASTQAAIDAGRLALQQAEATQDAAWTATAWIVTQTAAIVQTQTAYPQAALAYSQTQAAIPLIATTEAEKLIAVQNLYRAQGDDARRKAAQEVWASPLRLGSMVVAVAGGLLLIWYYIKHQKRVRKLTDDGAVNLVEDEKGIYHETRADLMATPSMEISSEGVKPEGETDYQQTVTTNAQKVKAIEAAARGARPQETFQVATDVMAAQVSRYQLDSRLQEGADLEGDVLKVLNDDWRSK